MDEDIKKQGENQQESPAEEKTVREIRDILNDLLPEEERSDDVDGMMRKYIENSEAYKSENEEMNTRISTAIAEDPLLANAFVAMVDGGNKDAARTLVKHLGRAFFTAEEGTPEYDEMVRADEEFMKEREALRLADEEFNKNFDESWALIQPFCEKHGINPEEFEDGIWSKIVEPLLQGKINDDLLLMMKKALDYDKDTEDAFAAGEVKGRNENINSMRRTPSDGMPKGLGTQAPVQDKPKRRNKLIEDALMYR